MKRAWQITKTVPVAVKSQFSRPPLRLLHSHTRPFSCGRSLYQDEKTPKRKGGPIDHAMEEAKRNQARTPWHREGSNKPPVKQLRSAGAMTKGKLLTTPARLLKLILPLTKLDKNDDRKNIEPLALLVHPQQPLSYLERLIQSELPMIKDKDGKDKVPSVHFRAEDSNQDQDEFKAYERDGDDVEDLYEEGEEGSDKQIVDGKRIKLGKTENEEQRQEKIKEELEAQNKKQEQKTAIRDKLRGGIGEGGVESYSGTGRERQAASNSAMFVRWSSSTEIGDFIRDAARGKEFAVEIEGAGDEIRVGVPSFNDRTHYLRLRLRTASKRLEDMASVKKECDKLAHRSAKRLATGGFGVLASWWGSIYYFTFMTAYGWDTMEPITYLGGLSTIMLGYLWFLYHNREVSYKSALNLTVSRRQSALYIAHKFDLVKWENLIEEANGLRKEIKMVAREYDVDWDETADEISKEVHVALKKERQKNGSDGKNDKDDDDAAGEKNEKDEKSSPPKEEKKDG
ncbi:hypothetical protein BJ878DRAFT_553099 [Calycina marina]|uniref:Calcium uniporter protein, mitochondrial n=1 Tax=Calycina marina TaxID=1763456 RepID=A0A9P7Z9Q1_9HELO|nr:hypothetical protein BJ878DRAFT_553099 [Calycina marina]